MARRVMQITRDSVPPGLDMCAAHGAHCFERVTNPYYGRRYDRQYGQAERSQLLTDLNVRSGIPEAELAQAPAGLLHKLLDTLRDDHEVDAAEARLFLEPDESHRVDEFIGGSARKRALLVGSVTVARFLDEFVIYSADDTATLVQHGRSVRQVVHTIDAMGGLEAAAARVPWLLAAVPLVRQMDWRRLASRLIFVRHACADEVASCPSLSGLGPVARMLSPGMSIEEGQHRAIAAAWLLTRNATEPSPIAPPLAYLRGVNRLGHACGEQFWDVSASRAEGPVCCALVLSLVWVGLRRRRASGRTRIKHA